MGDSPLRRIDLTDWQHFFQTQHRSSGSETRQGTFAPLGSAPLPRPANRRINVAGKKERRTMNPLTQSKNTTIRPVLIALALGCFALSPRVQAVDPPPDGGYDRFNTAEGTDALFSLTTLGFFNTATGFEALFSNTTGSANT